MDIRQQGQDLATGVAINNAKFKRGELGLKERQLSLDKTIQQLETLKANSILAKNTAATAEITQRIDKMKNEAAGLKAMTAWQSENQGQWPDAAMQAGAGFKPTQEKLPSEDSSQELDHKVLKDITGLLKNTGAFGSYTGETPASVRLISAVFDKVKNDSNYSRDPWGTEAKWVKQYTLTKQAYTRFKKRARQENSKVSEQDVQEARKAIKQDYGFDPEEKL